MSSRYDNCRETIGTECGYEVHDVVVDGTVARVDWRLGVLQHVVPYAFVFPPPRSLVGFVSGRVVFAPLHTPLFLRLRKRRQSEGRAKALCENESENGGFPTVFDYKDSAE